MGRLMKRVIKSSIMAATTALISNVLNLSETKVGKILSVAIPVVTFVVADDKSISYKLFEDSKKRKKGDRQTPEEGEKEFFNVFGDKSESMISFIARESDSTEEEVTGVLGMTMSVMEAGFSRVIKEDDIDEEEFNRRAKDEAEDQKKKMPSLFSLATKAIF